MIFALSYLNLVLAYWIIPFLKYGKMNRENQRQDQFGKQDDASPGES
jgi:hypothetical protein